MALGDPTPGSAGNVQGGDPGYEADKEGLAGLWQQVVGRQKKPQGPNAAAYNAQMAAASGSADAYGDRGLNYTQTGPTISNQYEEGDRGNVDAAAGQQRYSAQNMRDIVEGKDTTAAKAEIQQGTDAAIKAQMSAARSAKGGAASQAGAMRNASQIGAEQEAGVATKAGQLQAQLAMQAAQVESQTESAVAQEMMAKYGMSQQEALAQAQLQSQNQAQQNAMRLGYGALGNQAQGQSLGALDAYTGRNLQAQGLGQAGAAADSASTGQTLGTIAGVAAMAMSDINAKTAVHQEGFRQGMAAGGRAGPGQSPSDMTRGGAQLSTAPGYGQDTYAGQSPGGFQQPAPSGGTSAPSTYVAPYTPPTSSYAAALQPQAMSPSSSALSVPQPAGPSLAPLTSVREAVSPAANVSAMRAASPAVAASPRPAPALQPSAAANPAPVAQAAPAAARAPGLAAAYMSDEASKIMAQSESSTNDAIAKSMNVNKGPDDMAKVDMSAFKANTFKDTTSKYKDHSKDYDKSKLAGGTDVSDVTSGNMDTALPDYQTSTPIPDSISSGQSSPTATNQGVASWMQANPSAEGMSSMGSAGAGAAEAGAFESDERAKNIDKKHTLADDFLDGIHPLSYHYKQAQDEPRPDPTGGRYLGVTAQDLERVPEVGRQLVEDTPRGKMVIIKPTLSAALAGMARLNERVRHLEGKAK